MCTTDFSKQLFEERTDRRGTTIGKQSHRFRLRGWSRFLVNHSPRPGHDLNSFELQTPALLPGKNDAYRKGSRLYYPR